MKHSSASKSYEYCSVGKTAILLAFGAVKNCPISNGFADSLDTSFSKASTLSELPGVFCEAEHNRRAFLNAHRKTLTSAVPHADGYKWQAAFSGGPYDTKPAQPVAEFPMDQIRRTIQSGRLLRACLHICELVFFRLEFGVVAFFPRFNSPELDFFLVQNCPKRFDTNRRSDFFLKQIFTQFFK